MSAIDLHIHSCFSDDGELTPSEIVSQCSARNMQLIAITDHNSVGGISQVIGTTGNLKVIAGIEVDCTYHGELFHLLGYRFDYTRQEFTALEQDIIEQEKAAAEQKIKLFRDATQIPIGEDEVFAASDNGVVTGELIAELILAKENAAQYEILHPYLPGGNKSDMPNVRFYWDFFSVGKPAYVPITYLSLPDAVALIHSAGGIAVLAHPGQNLKKGDAILSKIIDEKIDGIEVFSSYHDNDERNYFLEIASSNHLLFTCGSDFHGKHKPNIQLGGHGSPWDDREMLNHFSNKLHLK